MKYSQLGRTGEKVSRICLGTMTWGEQNTREDAFEQMDYALDQGINFFDTAETYPVPGKGETIGRTEAFIGDWFKQSGKRDAVFLASKIAGATKAFHGGSSRLQYLRGGNTGFDKKNFTEAIEGSLKRLKTDRIDLYQLHWPERRANFFGRLGYPEDLDTDFTPFEEVLATLEDLMDQGKIRYCGVSNETAWGLMKYLHLSEVKNLPRMVSIQNPYSLLNRTFEVGLAEVALREDCGLLAYSPLAFGMLSGKYEEGAKPEGARLTLFADVMKRYTGEAARKATGQYVKVAREAGLDPARMALAFVNSRPFLTANIIGATTMDQLKADIDTINLELPEDVLEAIEGVHKSLPNPAP